MRASEVLIFLYTDPSFDWDWCLFECGFFAGLPDLDGRKRRLLCLNSGIGRPSPLDCWQDVSSAVLLGKELKKIGVQTGSDFVKRAGFTDFAANLWTKLTLRVPEKTDAAADEVPDATTVALKQRRMSIVVTPKAMQEIKAQGKINPEVQLEISEGAKEIFPNAPLQSSWSNFHSALTAPQQIWSESLAIMIRMLNGVRTNSPMLPLVRSGLAENVLFRPAVVQRDTPSGTTHTRYTVIFTRTPDATVASPAREDRIYHWLMLARNFRESIVEAYQRKLRELTMVHARELRQWLEDIVDDMALLRIDSESRGLRLQEELNLFCGESQRAIAHILEQWEGILDQFQKSVTTARGAEASNTPAKQVNALVQEVRNTLQDAARINQAFLLHISCALVSCVGSNMPG